MAVNEQLKEYARIVDRELEEFFGEKLQKAKKIDPSTAEMVHLLRDYTLRGGKRIRPALLYYGFNCFRKDNSRELVKASMCIELAHTFLLIHDDIMDQDAFRHNGPTLHKSYGAVASRYKTDKKHFGISMALCAGDICYAFANEILSNSKFPARHRLKALSYLNHTLHKVIYGQVLDILSSLKPVTPADVEKIHYLKTATYTFEAPLKLGAILAGASEKQLTMLEGYAIPLGKAFQLQDDILGMFGNEKELGKPVGSDLREGKKTLLMLKALEKASSSDKRFINKCLGSTGITMDQIEKVRSIITKTSSLAYSQSLINNLVRDGKDAIRKANLKPNSKSFLLGLADYLAERKY